VAHLDQLFHRESDALRYCLQAPRHVTVTECSSVMRSWRESGEASREREEEECV
jgi:hypothetical protein